MKKILCLLAVFVLIFSLAVPALAVDTGESLGIPSPYTLMEDEGYSYAVIVWSGSQRRLYLTNTISICSDTQFQVNSPRYYKLNGDSWSYLGSSGLNSLLDYSNLIWSSSDLIVDGVVYITHDPNFFPIPLWEKVGQVTQGEMTGLLRNLDGTLKVLVPCGVGCLASLAVLKLFGKRSLIYRS